MRIPININGGENVCFTLDQDFENLEILSLSVSTYDVYKQMTSDFGVVVGRVSVNGGFGVQNAKISLFLPLSADDELRSDIIQLYPFKAVTDTLPNGVRYNIFPRVKQSNISHQPIGIFPDVTDLTYYPTYLEIYEKYYTYTTTTNDSGDYILFGVPLGSQAIHMDFDLFDTKSFYITADDMITEVNTSSAISAQLSTGLTQAINPDFILTTGGTYEVLLNANIDSMPNIFTANNFINVIPFWGDSTSQNIGLTRCDFNINYKYTPTAILFGSFIEESPWSPPIGDWVSNNVYKMSRTDAVDVLAVHNPATNLKVIAYKLLSAYNAERYGIYTALPSADGSTNGVFMLSLPMYEDYYVTDEFGQLVSAGTNSDGTPSQRGIPTKGHYVFEFFDDNESIYGNGRRNPYGYNGINYSTNLAPAVRVPATRDGHTYMGGWEINNMTTTLFEYDPLKGTPRFYTVEAKFRPHAKDDLRNDGTFLSYVPKQVPGEFNFPVPTTGLTGTTSMRGTLYVPSFWVQDEGVGTSAGITYANELSWLPWLPTDQTSNYAVQNYDWLYGVGVKNLQGVNRGNVFLELYGTVDPVSGNKTMDNNGYPIEKTWFFGDNPWDSNNPPVVNIYATMLAQSPDSTNRQVNGVHNRFNLAVSPNWTAGLFVSSIESGSSKILFETSIADVTDIVEELITNNVYSSYGMTNNQYTDSNGDTYYYLFGKFPTWQNALYEIKNRYFND
jgi:hypothetical protein